jgi:hypothetical protein
MQTLGSPRHVLVFGDGDEYPELFERHVISVR